VSTLLEGYNDAFFLRGREAGEYRRFFGQLAEIFFVEIEDLVAGNDLAGIEVDVLADFAGDEGIVAREDFCRDSVAGE